MMGQHDRSEALFYYFRLEDQVPETHLLRLIEKHISFAFVREKLKDSYSDTGRPSIDPELLLRILLIGYLYGITSERKLVEELRMHLAWRWFTGLGFDQEIPHHSTFSKNRHGRFQESKLFEQLFEQIVRQCVEVGLVKGEDLSVDGSFVEANAAKQSRIPREQLAEAAQVHHTIRQYLVELEQQNPVEEPAHQQDQVSTTDPDSTYATKGGTPARLGYYDNYLVDNQSCVIVGVQATAARMSQETVAAHTFFTQQRITGTVTLRLYKGGIQVVGRESENALYDERFVTFGEDDVYQQSDAAGFIRLFALPARVRAIKDQELAAATQPPEGAPASPPGTPATPSTPPPSSTSPTTSSEHHAPV